MISAFPYGKGNSYCSAKRAASRVTKLINEQISYYKQLQPFGNRRCRRIYRCPNRAFEPAKHIGSVFQNPKANSLSWIPTASWRLDWKTKTPSWNEWKRFSCNPAFLYLYIVEAGCVWQPAFRRELFS